ncbi:hypothetical protein ACVVIH_06880 [Chryseobacterium arthrosphaerae]
MAKERKISFRDMKILSIYALLGLKRSKKVSSEITQNVNRLTIFIENFFEKDEDGNMTEIKLDFQNNHHPKHWLLKNYYGPEDGFQNVSFGQYIDGLDEYIYYTNTGDMEALRMLFAIFYLRKGEKYDSRISKKRAKGIFKYVDIRHLYGFYLFFSSIQTYVLGGEINVMGNPIDLSLIYTASGSSNFKSNIPGTGMRNVISDLAESQVFGPYKGVEETNMWIVLIRLYELKKKELDDQERNKNNETART